MAIFEWDDSYSVSVKRMDEQHQKMLSLLNDINVAYNEGRGKDFINHILAELSTYAMTHFAAEEALMLRTQFPEYEQHQREHHDLTEELKAFIKKYEDGSIRIELDFLLFVRDWVVHHIAETDKRYSAHFNSLGID